MRKIKALDPKDFANAYIQTLKFELDSSDEVDNLNYHNKRRVFFLEEYVRAYADASTYFKELEEISKKLFDK